MIPTVGFNMRKVTKGKVRRQAYIPPHALRMAEFRSQTPAFLVGAALRPPSCSRR